MDIKEVWKRITSHAGELFYTKRGVPYTYHISGQRIVLENTNRNIPYRDIERALSLPDLSVTKLNQINVQGPSYLYGIITDRRIIG